MTQASAVDEIDVIHIVKASPWREAIVSILGPGSRYNAFSGAEDAEPGDGVVVVLDTEPVSVFAGVGVVRAYEDPHALITGGDDFRRCRLLELGTLNALADFVIDPRGSETVFHSESLGKVVDLLRGVYPFPGLDELSGHTSLAAARILLHSGGACTSCGDRLGLYRAAACERVHIRTVDWAVGDWPAVLCDACHERMCGEGFTNFVEFRLSLNPPCPKCGARHSLSAVYGLAPGTLPWGARMGCRVVEPRAEWVCTDCRHQW